MQLVVKLISRSRYHVDELGWVGSLSKAIYPNVVSSGVMRDAIKDFQLHRS